MTKNESLEYLQDKLDHHRNRVLVRYKQYDQKYVDIDYGITIPPYLRAQYRAVAGWTSKAVDALADRLIFREFANDDFEINNIFRANNSDILFDSTILGALVSSCSFVSISPKGHNELPELQVIDGGNATGVIDQTTGLLEYGYAVLSRDDNGHPYLEALYEPYRVTLIEDGKVQKVINHNVAYPLLVPIIHRPDAVRPFGRSRITRSAMYWQRYAKRTLERADITAEFYSFPQKYILGMSNEAEAMDTYEATITSMLRIDKDSDGDRPIVGQFQTQSMTPFIDQLRMAAAGFAGETGLTLDDLGFVSDNPSSSEAIKASHENLRMAAKKAQRCFGVGFRNVGYLASCVRDDKPYKRYAFLELEPRWEPIFEPDASTISLVGDGAIKVNQAIPGYFNKDNLRDLTGIEGAE